MSRDPRQLFSFTLTPPSTTFFSEPRERERIRAPFSISRAHCTVTRPSRAQTVFFFLFFYVCQYFCVTLEPRNYACRCYPASSSYAHSTFHLFVITFLLDFLLLLHTYIVVRRACFPGKVPSASASSYHCHRFLLRPFVLFDACLPAQIPRSSRFRRVFKNSRK